jgi:hypothetical protein
MQSYSLVFFRKAIPVLKKYFIALLWHTRILHETTIEAEVTANAGINAEI